MVHLHNIGNEIQDTSANGRYHNKKFKETAEAHGLVIEKDSRHGWTITKLHESTAQWIDNNIDHKGFDLARAKKEKKTAGKKSKYNYYMCPCCGVKFYSVHEIRATCEDCGEEFIQYK
jgi:transcription initiation factor IIE alpha subunit